MGRKYEKERIPIVNRLQEEGKTRKEISGESGLQNERVVKRWQNKPEKTLAYGLYLSSGFMVGTNNVKQLFRGTVRFDSGVNPIYFQFKISISSAAFKVASPPVKVTPPESKDIILQLFASAESLLWDNP